MPPPIETAALFIDTRPVEECSRYYRSRSGSRARNGFATRSVRDVAKEILSERPLPVPFIPGGPHESTFRGLRFSSGCARHLQPRAFPAADRLSARPLCSLSPACLTGLGRVFVFPASSCARAGRSRARLFFPVSSVVIGGPFFSTCGDRKCLPIIGVMLQASLLLPHCLSVACQELLLLGAPLTVHTPWLTRESSPARVKFWHRVLFPPSLG